MEEFQKFPEKLENLSEESKGSSLSPSRHRSLGFSGVKSEFMQQFLIANPHHGSISEDFLIKNIDTGESYDLRKLETLEKLTDFKFISSSNRQAWKSYWKEISSFNERLWDSSELGDIETMKSLIKTNKLAFSFDINAKSLDDWTALHLACNEGHIQIVELLLAHNKINIEAETTMKRRPLHIAAIRGHCEIVMVLMKFGCELSPEDVDLYTPLHYASEHGYESIVRQLLMKKVKYETKTYQGMTAMDLSQDHRIRDIFKEFDENAINEASFGRTSIGNCIRNNARADYVNKWLLFGNKLAIK